ncbi:MAG: ATP-binding protein [Armatimonadetes bacterium]|nr:ATP-binding protein [Armatimonadota bacterium]
MFQRLVETRSTGPLRIALCGSSQRMMYGLALDAAAPLYGRAREVLKVEPLAAKWIRNALRLDDREAVEAYSVWGGLPRNWELAAAHKGTDAAMKALVLDKAGILHGEPPRLLLDDLRSAVQAGSILSLVGAGAHRIGEIASRLGRPVTALTRPLALLVDLGYIRREVPFGESPLSSRRSLYRIADPFVEFWYRFVQPAGSLLEMDLVEDVHSRIRAELPSHVAGVWEHLARRSVPRLPIDGVAWGPASRWWGNDLAGRPIEVDVAAESLDGRHVLVGEAKWSARRQTAGLIARLRELSPKLPFVRGRTVHLAAWVRDEERESFEEVSLIGPRATLDAS